MVLLMPDSDHIWNHAALIKLKFLQNIHLKLSPHFLGTAVPGPFKMLGESVGWVLENWENKNIYCL